MATTFQSEQVYSHEESIGVAVLIACSVLSLITILAVFVILGVSAVQSRRSSDNTLFVRTQVARYFVSLLICNLIQAIGGLLNIPWIAEGRVYVGVTCTAQAVLKQIGNIGTAIFTFVIGAHTFCHLFLRRKYTDRTCYITLIGSLALVLLELCIENFLLAKSQERHLYYGVAGYWCWITPVHRIERYTTGYLFMFVSVGFSFILYSLVFFRLRGNISVSNGCKISFHRRPKVRAGRTSGGTYITTDDRRIESHLTTVAKHMLWYPIVYSILVLPVAASRFSEFSGIPVPFSVTMIAASVFMLHGFFNTVLFCTTRDILPGGWKQRFGLVAMASTRRGDVDPSRRTDRTWFTATRTGTIGIETAPIVRSVGVGEGLGIKYVAEPSTSYVKFGSPISPTSSTFPPSLLRAHGGGGHRDDAHEHHIRRLSSSAPQGAGLRIHFEVVEGDEDSGLSVGQDS